MDGLADAVSVPAAEMLDRKYEFVRDKLDRKIQEINDHRDALPAKFSCTGAILRIASGVFGLAAGLAFSYGYAKPATGLGAVAATSWITADQLDRDKSTTFNYIQLIRRVNRLLDRLNLDTDQAKKLAFLNSLSVCLEGVKLRERNGVYFFNGGIAQLRGNVRWLQRLVG